MVAQAQTAALDDIELADQAAVDEVDRGRLQGVARIQDAERAGRARGVLLEVGEKGGVRQCLQTRGIISHDIGVAWDEADKVAVAVFTLV